MWWDCVAAQGRAPSAPATMKRKALATATAQSGVSSDGRKLTLGTGWRNLTLPPFTYNSMAYGRGAAQAEEQPEERIATTTVTAPEAKPTKTASEAAYDDLLTTLESPCNEAISLVSLNRLIYALLCAVTANTYFCRQDEATGIAMKAQMKISTQLLAVSTARPRPHFAWQLLPL